MPNGIAICNKGKRDGFIFLACCRYIELNPVRAQMVKAPEDYPWSSYRQRLGMNSPAWLNRDPCHLELGPTEALRRQRYQQFVREAIPEGEWSLIREALQRGQLTGSQRFIDEVEHILGKRIELRGQGRPRKTPAG